jgi:hypothetical protein
MKVIKEIQFEANIVREYSSKPKVDDLGRQKCKMTLYRSEKNESNGAIEFETESECVGIGLTFSKNELLDYDGVFELPREAIELMESCGIKVGEDFK